MKTKDILPVVENIIKMMKDKDLKQATIAEYMGTSASQLSRILKGDVQVSVLQLANLATKLNINIIDIFTYPRVFVPSDITLSDVKAQISFDINEEIVEKVMNLVIGNSDIKLVINTEDSMRKKEYKVIKKV